MTTVYSLEMPSEEYILGVSDDEIERLGIQHRVWRTHMLEGWRTAGFSLGSHILDVGAGPGFAATDLAELVGPRGRVTAVEISDKFCRVGSNRAASMGLANLHYQRHDLVVDELPANTFDHAWCRWVFAFVSSPEAVAQRVCSALKPNGTFVIHEYLQYNSWRILPNKPACEEFVEQVMKQWLDSNGEYDVARKLPEILQNLDMDIIATRPMIFQMKPNEYAWNWPARFIRNQVPMLLEQGRITTELADSVLLELAEAESDPNSIMISPVVFEIVAQKR